MIDAHNAEAEQSVIGAVLIDPEHVLSEIIDVLRPQEFFVPMYGEFYRYVCEMTAQGKKIDFVTMAEAMKSKVDGNVKQELLKCAEMVPSVANARAYAEIVAKNARARKAQTAISDATYEPLTAENVDYVIEKLMAALYEQTEQSKPSGKKSMRESVLDWYASLFEPRPDRIDTGFTDLDRILRGMFSGNLTLLAARPAVGKTALAMEIARNVAMKGKTVNVYSYEMQKTEIIERMAANESGVDMDTLIDNELLRGKTEAVNALAQTADRLSKLPINIIDDASITTAGIRAQCRMTKNLGLVVVDYIQLIRPTQKHANRADEVGEISRSLKLLASDLNVPVLALSQLNRDIEKRGANYKKPQMSDLRDSGSLEQDANKIMFIYPLTEDENRKIVGVEVAKNRRGHTGEAQFVFDGAHMRHEQLIKTDYIKHNTRADNPYWGR